MSADGQFGSSDEHDLNGACSSSSIEASNSLSEVSNTTFECSSVTKKRKCKGNENCEWVRVEMEERGLKKGKRRRRGMCKAIEKPKKEPKKEEPQELIPKCAPCAFTGTACCGTCVNNGPAFCY